MKTRAEMVAHCLEFPGAYEDYPFSDTNWTVMRRRDTSKGFAWIYERGGILWVNLKSAPEDTSALCSIHPAITPGYHMNKRHWISVPLDGSVSEALLDSLLQTSWELCS